MYGGFALLDHSLLVKFNGTFDIDTLKVVFQVRNKLTFFLIVVYQYVYLKFRVLKQPRG